MDNEALMQLASRSRRRGLPQHDGDDDGVPTIREDPPDAPMPPNVAGGRGQVGSGTVGRRGQVVFLGATEEPFESDEGSSKSRALPKEATRAQRPSVEDGGKFSCSSSRTGKSDAGSAKGRGKPSGKGVETAPTSPSQGTKAPRSRIGADRSRAGGKQEAELQFSATGSGAVSVDSGEAADLYVKRRVDEYVALCTSLFRKKQTDVNTLAAFDAGNTSGAASQKGGAAAGKTGKRAMQFATDMTFPEVDPRHEAFVLHVARARELATRVEVSSSVLDQIAAKVEETDKGLREAALQAAELAAYDIRIATISKKGDGADKLHGAVHGKHTHYIDGLVVQHWDNRQLLRRYVKALRYVNQHHSANLYTPWVATACVYGLSFLVATVLPVPAHSPYGTVQRHLHKHESTKLALFNLGSTTAVRLQGDKPLEDQVTVVYGTDARTYLLDARHLVPLCAGDVQRESYIGPGTAEDVWSWVTDEHAVDFADQFDELYVRISRLIEPTGAARVSQPKLLANAMHDAGVPIRCLQVVRTHYTQRGHRTLGDSRLVKLRGKAKGGGNAGGAEADAMLNKDAVKLLDAELFCRAFKRYAEIAWSTIPLNYVGTGSWARSALSFVNRAMAHVAAYCQKGSKSGKSDEVVEAVERLATAIYADPFYLPPVEFNPRDLDVTAVVPRVCELLNLTYGPDGLFNYVDVMWLHPKHRSTVVIPHCASGAKSDVVDWVLRMRKLMQDYHATTKWRQPFFQIWIATLMGAIKGDVSAFSTVTRQVETFGFNVFVYEAEIAAQKALLRTNFVDDCVGLLVHMTDAVPVLHSYERCNTIANMLRVVRGLAGVSNAALYRNEQLYRVLRNAYDWLEELVANGAAVRRHCSRMFYTMLEVLIDHAASNKRFKDAIDWGQKKLDLVRLMYGLNATEVAAMRTELASFFAGVENYEEAEALHLKALKFYESEDYDSVQSSICRGNVGLVKFQHAEMLHTKKKRPAFLFLLRPVFPPDVTKLCNDAEHYFKLALDNRIILPDEVIAATLNNLGTVYLFRNNTSVAEARFKEAIEVTDKLPDPRLSAARRQAQTSVAVVEQRRLLGACLRLQAYARRVTARRKAERFKAQCMRICVAQRFGRGFKARTDLNLWRTAVMCRGDYVLVCCRIERLQAAGRAYLQRRLIGRDSVVILGERNVRRQLYRDHVTISLGIRAQHLSVVWLDHTTRHHDHHFREFVQRLSRAHRSLRFEAVEMLEDQDRFAIEDEESYLRFITFQQMVLTFYAAVLQGMKNLVAYAKATIKLHKVQERQRIGFDRLRHAEETSVREVFVTMYVDLWKDCLSGSQGMHMTFRFEKRRMLTQARETRTRQEMYELVPAANAREISRIITAGFFREGFFVYEASQWHRLLDAAHLHLVELAEFRKRQEVADKEAAQMRQFHLWDHHNQARLMYDAEGSAGVQRYYGRDLGVVECFLEPIGRAALIAAADRRRSRRFTAFLAEVFEMIFDGECTDDRRAFDLLEVCQRVSTDEDAERRVLVREWAGTWTEFIPQISDERVEVHRADEICERYEVTAMPVLETRESIARKEASDEPMLHNLSTLALSTFEAFGADVVRRHASRVAAILNIREREHLQLVEAAGRNDLTYPSRKGLRDADLLQHSYLGGLLVAQSLDYVGRHEVFAFELLQLHGTFGLKTSSRRLLAAARAEKYAILIPMWASKVPEYYSACFDILWAKLAELKRQSVSFQLLEGAIEPSARRAIHGEEDICRFQVFYAHRLFVDLAWVEASARCELLIPAVVKRAKAARLAVKKDHSRQAAEMYSEFMLRRRELRIAVEYYGKALTITAHAGHRLHWLQSRQVATKEFHARHSLTRWMLTSERRHEHQRLAVMYRCEAGVAGYALIEAHERRKQLTLSKEHKAVSAYRIRNVLVAFATRRECAAGYVRLLHEKAGVITAGVQGLRARIILGQLYQLMRPRYVLRDVCLAQKDELRQDFADEVRELAQTFITHVALRYMLTEAVAHSRIHHELPTLHALAADPFSAFNQLRREESSDRELAEVDEAHTRIIVEEDAGRFYLEQLDSMEGEGSRIREVFVEGRRTIAAHRLARIVAGLASRSAVNTMFIHEMRLRYNGVHRNFTGYVDRYRLQRRRLLFAAERNGRASVMSMAAAEQRAVLESTSHGACLLHFREVALEAHHTAKLALLAQPAVYFSSARYEAAARRAADLCQMEDAVRWYVVADEGRWRRCLERLKVQLAEMAGRAMATAEARCGVQQLRKEAMWCLLVESLASQRQSVAYQRIGRGYLRRVGFRQYQATCLRGAKLLQRIGRGYMGQRSVFSKQVCLLIVKRMLVGYIVRSRLRKRLDAALPIQRWWQDILASRRFVADVKRRVHNKATAIQSVWRGLITRRWLVRRLASCCVIQRAIRQAQSCRALSRRRTATVLVNHKRAAVERIPALRELAATDIQRACRGFRVRSVVRRIQLTRTALATQRFLRSLASWRLRQNCLSHFRVVPLQAAVRGFLQRCLMSGILLPSAVRIQRVYRYSLRRQRGKETLHTIRITQLEDRIGSNPTLYGPAIAALHAVARAYSTRVVLGQTVHMRRWAAVTIQRWFRRQLRMLEAWEGAYYRSSDSEATSGYSPVPSSRASTPFGAAAPGSRVRVGRFSRRLPLANLVRRAVKRMASTNQEIGRMVREEPPWRRQPDVWAVMGLDTHDDALRPADPSSPRRLRVPPARHLAAEWKYAPERFYPMALRQSGGPPLGAKGKVKLMRRTVRAMIEFMRMEARHRFERQRLYLSFERVLFAEKCLLQLHGRLRHTLAKSYYKSLKRLWYNGAVHWKHQMFELCGAGARYGEMKEAEEHHRNIILRDGYNEKIRRRELQRQLGARRLQVVSAALQLQQVGRRYLAYLSALQNGPIQRIQAALRCMGAVRDALHAAKITHAHHQATSIGRVFRGWVCRKSTTRRLNAAKRIQQCARHKLVGIHAAQRRLRSRVDRLDMVLSRQRHAEEAGVMSAYLRGRLSHLTTRQRQFNHVVGSCNVIGRWYLDQLFRIRREKLCRQLLEIAQKSKMLREEERRRVMRGLAASDSSEAGAPNGAESTRLWGSVRTMLSSESWIYAPTKSAPGPSLLKRKVLHLMLVEAQEEERRQRALLCQRAADDGLLQWVHACGAAVESLIRHELHDREAVVRCLVEVGCSEVRHSLCEQRAVLLVHPAAASLARVGRALLIRRKLHVLRQLPLLSQPIGRGHLARRRLSKIKSARQKEQALIATAELARRNNAAAAVQAGWRGSRCRAVVRRQATAACKMQRWARRYTEGLRVDGWADLSRKRQRHDNLQQWRIVAERMCEVQAFVRSVDAVRLVAVRRRYAAIMAAATIGTWWSKQQNMRAAVEAPTPSSKPVPPPTRSAPMPAARRRGRPNEAEWTTSALYKSGLTAAVLRGREPTEDTDVIDGLRHDAFLQQAQLVSDVAQRHRRHIMAHEEEAYASMRAGCYHTLYGTQQACTYYGTVVAPMMAAATLPALVARSDDDLSLLRDAFETGSRIMQLKASALDVQRVGRGFIHRCRLTYRSTKQRGGLANATAALQRICRGYTARILLHGHRTNVMSAWIIKLQQIMRARLSERLVAAVVRSTPLQPSAVTLSPEDAALVVQQFALSLISRKHRVDRWSQQQQPAGVADKIYEQLELIMTGLLYKQSTSLASRLRVVAAARTVARYGSELLAQLRRALRYRLKVREAKVKQLASEAAKRQRAFKNLISTGCTKGGSGQSTTASWRTASLYGGRVGLSALGSTPSSAAPSRSATPAVAMPRVAILRATIAVEEQEKHNRAAVVLQRYDEQRHLVQIFLLSWRQHYEGEAALHHLAEVQSAVYHHCIVSCEATAFKELQEAARVGCCAAAAVTIQRNVALAHRTFKLQAATSVVARVAASAATRCQLSHFLWRRRNEGAVVCQAFSRFALSSVITERSRLLLLHRSATRLQAVWRGARCRGSRQSRLDSCVVIQQWHRLMLQRQTARRKTKTVAMLSAVVAAKLSCAIAQQRRSTQRCIQAVTRIQRWYRWVVRSVVADVGKLLDDWGSPTEEEQSTTRASSSAVRSRPVTGPTAAQGSRRRPPVAKRDEKRWRSTSLYRSSGTTSGAAQPTPPTGRMHAHALDAVADQERVARHKLTGTACRSIWSLQRECITRVAAAAKHYMYTEAVLCNVASLTEPCRRAAVVDAATTSLSYLAASFTELKHSCARRVLHRVAAGYIHRARLVVKQRAAAVRVRASRLVCRVAVGAVCRRAVFIDLLHRRASLIQAMCRASVSSVRMAAAARRRVYIAPVEIQSRWRGVAARRCVITGRHAAAVIQRCWRCHLSRSKLALVAEKQRCSRTEGLITEAAAVVQAFLSAVPSTQRALTLLRYADRIAAVELAAMQPKQVEMKAPPTRDEPRQYPLPPPVVTPVAARVSVGDAPKWAGEVRPTTTRVVPSREAVRSAAEKEAADVEERRRLKASRDVVTPASADNRRHQTWQAKQQLEAVSYWIRATVEEEAARRQELWESYAETKLPTFAAVVVDFYAGAMRTALGVDLFNMYAARFDGHEGFRRTAIGEAESMRFRTICHSAASSHRVASSSTLCRVANGYRARRRGYRAHLRFSYLRRVLEGALCRQRLRTLRDTKAATLVCSVLRHQLSSAVACVKWGVVERGVGRMQAVVRSATVRRQQLLRHTAAQRCQRAVRSLIARVRSKRFRASQLVHRMVLARRSQRVVVAYRRRRHAYLAYSALLLVQEFLRCRQSTELTNQHMQRQPTSQQLPGIEVGAGRRVSRFQPRPPPSTSHRVTWTPVGATKIKGGSLPEPEELPVSHGTTAVPNSVDETTPPPIVQPPRTAGATFTASYALVPSPVTKDEVATALRRNNRLPNIKDMLSGDTAHGDVTEPTRHVGSTPRRHSIGTAYATPAPPKTTRHKHAQPGRPHGDVEKKRTERKSSPTRHRRSTYSYFPPLDSNSLPGLTTKKAFE